MGRRLRRSSGPCYLNSAKEGAGVFGRRRPCCGVSYSVLSAGQVRVRDKAQPFPSAARPQAAEDAGEIADWSHQIGWDVTYQQVTRGNFAGEFHASTRTGLVLHYHHAQPSVIIRGAAPRGMFAVAVTEVALTPPIFQGHR